MLKFRELPQVDEAPRKTFAELTKIEEGQAPWGEPATCFTWKLPTDRPDDMPAFLRDWVDSTGGANSKIGRRVKVLKALVPTAEYAEDYNGTEVILTLQPGVSGSGNVYFRVTDIEPEMAARPVIGRKKRELPGMPVEPSKYAADADDVPF